MDHRFLFALLIINIGVQGSRYGNHYEGDIAVRGGQRPPSGVVLSAFVSNKKLRWSKVVQFSIGEDLSDYTELIVEVLQWIADRSCLIFKEGTTGDHIKFTSFGDNDNSGQGCWSYFGRQGGQQAINLEIPSCLSKDTIFHEVFHALGKVHEQSRPDRDEHVQILVDNIVAGQEHNFAIQKNVDPAGTAYDLLSIMHYAPTAFSKNGEPTIIAKGGRGSKFGTTEEPTETDLYELNAAYECKAETGTEDDTDAGYELDTEGSGLDTKEGSGLDTDGSGLEYVTFEYADYENTYADYGDISNVIELINSQYGR